MRQVNLDRPREGLADFRPAFGKLRTLDFHHQSVNFFLHGFTQL
jgi:hypothetical protein